MKRNFFYGYIILAVIFFLQIIMFGSQLAFGVFIKPITADTGWTTGLVSGAFSAYSVIQAFSAMMMGWLNDRIGPRLVVTMCGALSGAGLILMYFVHSTWQLYLFYGALAGIGGGGLLAPQMSTVARWFVRRRNMATAVIFAGGGTGGFIGPPIVTWLIYSHNWREAFLFVGIVLLVIVILGAQFLKRNPAALGQLPDGDREAVDTINKAPADFSGLTPKQAIRTRKLWFLSIAYFCIGFCLWTVFLHIVPLAIDRGNSPEAAALILSFMSGAQPLGSIVLGITADKIGSGRALLICACLLLAVTFLLLPVANPWLIGLIVVIMSFGLGGASVIQSSMTAELFGMKSHGAIVGISIFTFAIGGALGTYLGGLVYDMTGSYRVALSICVGLVALAIIMAVILNRMRKTEAAA
jgi:MFS family permease